MATITHSSQSVDLRTDARRKRFEIQHWILSPPVVIISLGLAIVLTSFFYLSAFNDIASQGVILNDLERDRSQLIIKNEVWNMRIAKLKSLDVIEKQDVIKRMVTIDPAEIEFINLDRLEKR